MKTTPLAAPHAPTRAHAAGSAARLLQHESRAGPEVADGEVEGGVPELERVIARVGNPEVVERPMVCGDDGSRHRPCLVRIV